MTSKSALTKPLVLHGPTPTSLPRLIYGTAWKKSQTQPLVRTALSAGFRAIDTAAQPRHYREPLVAAALRDAIAQKTVSRADVYVQTKYTSLSGQDRDDLPYDPDAELEEQVRQSVESSLRNFTVDGGGGGGEDAYLDCLVLHGPLPTMDETLRVWRAMAAFMPHKVRHLGISNVPLATLRALLAEADPKPAVVQNRLRQGSYEPDIYALCRDNAIVFQPFWTLTANPNLLRSAFVGRVAEGAGVSTAPALYALLMGLGNFAVLDGTTQEVHMRDDLEGVEKVGVWAEREGKAVWEECVGQLKEALGYTF